MLAGTLEWIVELIMALATQCPHCLTTFRVANDQLKLRAGQVRCGTCREVFNGIDYLIRPTPAAEVEATPVAPTAQPVERGAATQLGYCPPSGSPVVANKWFGVPRSRSASLTAPTRSPSLASAQPTEPTLAQPHLLAQDYHEKLVVSLAPEKIGMHTATRSDNEKKSPAVWHTRLAAESDPLQRMTLFQVAGALHPAAPDQLNMAEDLELDRLIDELQNRPWGARTHVSEAVPVASLTSNSAVSNQDTQASLNDVMTEPRFMQQSSPRISRLRTGMWWIVTVLLTLGLTGQVAYYYRDQLAAAVPQIKPLLNSACGKLGCKINLPADIDSISIESNQLQVMASERQLYALTLVMRNRNSTVQAWPAIALTLNDANEKAIARRVFGPADYLASAAELTGGLRPHAERAIKLNLELPDLNASGYRVYLFYP